MVSRLRDLIPVRVNLPPPAATAAERQWQRDITDSLNDLPTLSIFSFSDPNSNFTAQSPALGFNLASGVSGLWFKQVGSSNTGWVALA